MANVSSQAGQLMRSGVVRLLQKKKKKPKGNMLRMCRLSSYSREAFKESEAGQTQVTKAGKTRVYAVTLIEEGLGNSKDKNYYGAQALENAVSLFEGAKCFCDHPDAIREQTLPERSMKEMVGWYTGILSDKGPDGRVRLRGKLHIFPGNDWLTTKIDTILTNPEADKKLFGISINAVGRTRPAEMGGEEVNLVEEFQRVDSADIVTEPAARGSFDKILESQRHSTAKGRVTNHGKIRESMTAPRMKDLAEQAIQAYSSDNPDEMKTALAEIGNQLLAQSSLSGKGPGEANETAYTNRTSGGSTVMPKTQRVAASARPATRRTRTSTGTAANNKIIPEPGKQDLDDLDDPLGEADVEGEEGKEDLGSFDDFGNSAKHARSVKASGRPGQRTVRASAEDEGAFDSTQQGGGAPMMAADEDEAVEHDFPGDGDGQGAGNDMVGQDMAGDDEEAEAGPDQVSDYPDETLSGEEEAVEAYRESYRARVHASREARARRSGTREASAGEYGKAGKDAIPQEVIGRNPKGQGEGNKPDNSSKSVGKSYVIKTSRAGGNRAVEAAVREANRRIVMVQEERDELLTQIARLRESREAIVRRNQRLSSILRHKQSIQEGNALLREAVEKQLLPEDLAFSKEFRESLYGLPYESQRSEILKQARILQSLDSTLTGRLRESGDGGVRGGFASGFSPSTADNDSPLEAAFADAGIPMLGSSDEE